MRRLAVGLMIMMCLALAGEAAAQQGSADPLGLIASAAVQPYWAAGAFTTIIEVTSPVWFNSGTFQGFDVSLEGFWYNAACNKLLSFPRPTTRNDIETFQPEDYGIDTNGLLVLAASLDSVNLAPISWPIHVRGHWVSILQDFIRVVDPISADAAETDPPITWNPLRSAANFINPQQSAAGVSTSVFLICPNSTVYNAVLGRPTPPAVTTTIFVTIYRHQDFVLDKTIPCTCLQTFSPITAIDPVYLVAPGPDTSASSVVDLYYTELWANQFVTAESQGGFTGYRAQTVSSILGVAWPDGSGDSFGRIPGASRGAYANGLIPIDNAR